MGICLWDIDRNDSSVSQQQVIDLTEHNGGVKEVSTVSCAVDSGTCDTVDSAALWLRCHCAAVLHYNGERTKVGRFSLDILREGIMTDCGQTMKLDGR